VGCGLPQIIRQDYDPCKPQIATDNYSIRTRNGRRPGLGFDDACVLPTLHFRFVSSCKPKMCQNRPTVGRIAAYAVMSRVKVKSGAVHVALLWTVLGKARGLFHGGSMEALYTLQFQDSLIKALLLCG
jgi:hypothetical protein